MGFSCPPKYIFSLFLILGLGA